MTKLKVLSLITKSDAGGAQKYVHDLATHLDPARFEAKILYGSKDIRWLSNRVYPWFLFLNDIFAVFEMVHVFKKERPSIVHLNSSKAGVLGSLAAFFYKLMNSRTHELKTVFTAHGWVFNPTNYISIPVRFFYILLHRFAAYFTDTIICVSEYDRTLALRYHIAPAYKLVTIHNGIDPNIPFLPKEESRKKILRRLSITNYQLPITANWVGSLGRLVKEKNYTTLIEAAYILATKYEHDTNIRNILFFIFGEGYEKEKLKLLITNYQLLDRFFLIPSAEEDRLLLKAFDVFVLPSIKEGFPYSLLEAMAAGIPAVVTNAGGMPEVAEHCSQISTVPIHDANVLAAEIQNMLNRNKKATPCVPFSLQTMVTDTATLYHTLCG